MASQRFGRYLATELLGSGGMAEVYAGLHPELGRKVAIKVILPQFAAESSFEERFRREARVVASLRHPHIVQIYDYDVVEGRHFMVMEYLEGGTLKDQLRARSRDKASMSLPEISLPEIAGILDAMAGALDYAHARGTVHRDIKPANILFTASQEAVLSDFGIAKLMEESARLTATGGIVGSPFYMPPEQASGGEVDARSDQYSLGIVLYEMATGRLPFRGTSPMAVLSQHLNSAPPAPRSLNPALPLAVEAVLLKVLAKHPADRFGSAGEFAQAFRQALEGRNPNAMLGGAVDENAATLLSQTSASAENASARNASPDNALNPTVGDVGKVGEMDAPTVLSTEPHPPVLAEDTATVVAERADTASPPAAQSVVPPLSTPAIAGAAQAEPPPKASPLPTPIPSPQNFQVGGIQAGIVNQGGEQNFSGNLTFNLDFGEIKGSPAQQQAPPQQMAGKSAAPGSVDDQEFAAYFEALRRAFVGSPRVERFVRLVTDFQAQLDALPVERANERKQVVKRVQALLIEMAESKADPDMVGIMGASLERAVQPLAEIDPDLPTMVTRITSLGEVIVQPG